jgi:hypothetical protein
VIEAEPKGLIACHCTECQRQSGSAFGMSLIVPREAFRMLSGEPRTFTRKGDSGLDVECAFCEGCGVRIYHQPSVMKTTVNVKPGTLDDTSGLDPLAHVWTSSKQAWVPIPDGVRQFPKNPPKPPKQEKS